MRYHWRIVPLYPSGRRVWVWLRFGRWWAHLDVGSHSFEIGAGGPERQPWLAPWQRPTPAGKAKLHAWIERDKRQEPPACKAGDRS